MFSIQTGTSQEKEQIEKERKSLLKIKISIIKLMAIYTKRDSCDFQQYSKEIQYNNREQCFHSDHLQFVINNPLTAT
jgi:hypothetical protein